MAARPAPQRPLSAAYPRVGSPLSGSTTPRGISLERVVVVGTSGSGKSTFARELATILDLPHVELDELHWDANWEPKPKPVFRELTSRAVEGSKWVIDGNYGVVRDIVWPRATTIVWLNYDLFTVFTRLLRRTLRRLAARELLWNGNRESFRLTFLSRESILVWAASTFHRRRREFAQLKQGHDYPHLAWLEFREPRQTERYLRAISEEASVASDREVEA